jgi:hypothetical protein
LSVTPRSAKYASAVLNQAAGAVAQNLGRLAGAPHLNFQFNLILLCFFTLFVVFSFNFQYFSLL